MIFDMLMGMAKLDICRTCGRELAARAKQDSPWYPFCSRRCRWVDLGQWFDQKYHLAETKGPLRDPEEDKNRANEGKSERK